jgi:hypothetical protein
MIRPPAYILESPVNSRQMLYLGTPQDRAGSPILGDFEIPVPPKVGGLNAAFVS